MTRLRLLHFSLFDVYKVPNDLKALLIRPYLNDKAKSIVSKLTPDVAGDYLRLKDALLHEFKCLLVPIWSDLTVVVKVLRSFTDVSRTITFPDRRFPDRCFLDKLY